MPSATLQAKIAAFESLAHRPSSSSLSSSPPSIVFMSSNHSRDGSESLLETPISPTTASALPPTVQFTPANARKQPPQPSPSPSPPNLGRRTSLIDLKDWVLEDEFSETANGIRHLQAASSRLAINGHHHEIISRPLSNGMTPKQAPSRVTAPLINLGSQPEVKPKPKHLISKSIIGDPPPQRSLRSIASSSSLQPSSTPHSYTSGSNNSLTVDTSHTYPPKLGADLRSKNFSGHVPASSISSFHSVSLSSDTDLTLPSHHHITTFPIEQDKERDLSFKSNGSDSVSLSESYEEVSSFSVVSPVTERLINLDWERASARRKSQPPRLPQRPTSSSTTALSAKEPPSRPPPPVGLPRSVATPRPSLTQAVNSASSRRMPPLPSRSSDRSSIRRNATSDSSLSVNYPTYQPGQSKPVPLPQPPVIAQVGIIQKTKRPTPIPPKARRRYEDLFNANVIQWRKFEKQPADKPALLSPSEARRSRQAAGWRGLSIDLTTAQADHHVVDRARGNIEDPVDRIVGTDDVLEGYVIHYIWTRSNLDKARLREIWNECDTDKKGVLNRESFVRGMWRIDEELRRTHSEPLKLVRSDIRSVGSRVGQKATPLLPQRQKAILK